MTATTLTEFLLARIADDEAWAQARWEPSVARSGPDTAVSIRLRKECEAKRRIVERCGAYDGDEMVADDMLRALAAVYADHPDYRPEWKPYTPPTLEDLEREDDEDDYGLRPETS